MPWSKLDDGLHEHPKIGAMTDKAFRLFVCAITYSSRHKLQGRLTLAHLSVLFRLTGAKQKHSDELVSLRSFDKDGDVYVIHDYAVYNPSQEELSTKRAEAGRLGGLQSGEARRSKSEAIASEANEANAKQNEATGPVPVSLPESHTRIPANGDSARGEPSMFTEFMSVYPKDAGRKDALREWWRVCPNPQVAGSAIVGLKKQIEAGVFEVEYEYIPFASNYLKGERWKDALPEKSGKTPQEKRQAKAEKWATEYESERGAEAGR